MRRFLGHAKRLLEPAQASQLQARRLVLLAMFAASAACSLGGTLLMPESYSWTTNVISESAAQGVEGAWLARLGFVLFGLSVLWLAGATRTRWARGTYWCHLAFGVFMVATAAFSHRPWLPDVSYDAFEDFLHSFTATVMGFAFSLALVFRLIQRSRNNEGGRARDVVAIVAAVVLPIIGGESPANAGWSQRVMFAIAYVWYAWETVSLVGSKPSSRA